MKHKKPASSKKLGKEKELVERKVKTTEFKGNILAPSCIRPTQNTDQMVFDFYKPACGNANQSPLRGHQLKINRN